MLYIIYVINFYIVYRLLYLIWPLGYHILYSVLVILLIIYVCEMQYLKSCEMVNYFYAVVSFYLIRTTENLTRINSYYGLLLIDIIYLFIFWRG